MCPSYLCRAVAWTLYMTKCDGFRLDAVKHVPVDFFGKETGQTDDPSFSGYTGAIQAMYDYVHGYGSNVTGNGYIETDGNRNSLFNTEAPRNDAMLFGEYEPSALAAGNDFYDYLNSGMRLGNFPLFSQLNNVFSGASMSGMDGRDYIPPGGQLRRQRQFQRGAGRQFSADARRRQLLSPQPSAWRTLISSCTKGCRWFIPMASIITPTAARRLFPMPIISANSATTTMPDTMYAAQPAFARRHLVALERPEHRRCSSATITAKATAPQPQTQDVALFGMNDKTGYPGDITFDDGVSRTSDGYYLNPSNTTSTAVSNSRGLGIVVGFPPGSVLAQLASSSPTGGRAYQKLLVHGATTSWSERNQFGECRRSDAPADLCRRPNPGPGRRRD